MFARTLAVAALLAAVAAGPVSPAPNPQPRLRGDIVSVDLPRLVVKTPEGQEVNVVLAEPVNVRAITPASWDDIKEGVGLGITSIQAGDKRVALGVHIFPPENTFNQSHAPWDLVEEENTMTNGIVGTVTEMGADHEVTLAYTPREGAPGEQAITIPETVDVVRMGEGTPDLLVPGAYVVIFGMPGADGTYEGRAATVGVDGARAPM